MTISMHWGGLQQGVSCCPKWWSMSGSCSWVGVTPNCFIYFFLLKHNHRSDSGVKLGSMVWQSCFIHLSDICWQILSHTWKMVQVGRKSGFHCGTCYHCNKTEKRNCWQIKILDLSIPKWSTDWPIDWNYSHIVNAPNTAYNSWKLFCGFWAKSISQCNTCSSSTQYMPERLVDFHVIQFFVDTVSYLCLAWLGGVLMAASCSQAIQWSSGKLHLCFQNTKSKTRYYTIQSTQEIFINAIYNLRGGFTLQHPWVVVNVSKALDLWNFRYRKRTHCPMYVLTMMNAQDLGLPHRWRWQIPTPSFFLSFLFLHDSNLRPIVLNWP